MNLTNPKVRERFDLFSLLRTQSDYRADGLLLRLIDGMPANGWAIGVGQTRSAIRTSLTKKFGAKLISYLTAADFGHETNIAPTMLDSHRNGIFLDAKNIDRMVLSHPFADLSNSQLPVEQFKFRTIDKEFFHAKERAAVAVIHFSTDFAAIKSSIGGGHRLIKNDQPALFFEGINAADQSDLLRLLNSVGYELVDSLLQPIDVVENLLPSEKFFVGISSSKLKEHILPRLLWGSAGISSSNLVRGLFDEARHAKNHVSPLSESSTFEYSFNDELNSVGFYKAEYSENSVWRWLGPTPTAQVFLTRPPPGRYHFEVKIIGSVLDEYLENLVIAFQGDSLSVTCKEDAGTKKLTGIIDVAPLTETRNIQLTFVIPGTRRVSGDDSRRLGICISSFTLRRV